MGEYRIVIVDDHKVFLDSLALAVGQCSDHKIVGTALNGTDALDLINKKVDMVICDLNMPGNYKLEFIRALKTNHTHVKVLVLTMYDERRIIRQLSRLKVDGYVPKGAGLEELLTGIEMIRQGRRYFRQSPESRPKAKKVEDDFAKQFKLTKRELEVLTLIARDCSSKEISQQLKVSVATIATHRKNVMRKLNLHSASALTKFALENGLV
ncbi:MAG: response regulator [Salibacteraceae bacterium]